VLLAVRTICEYFRGAYAAHIPSAQTVLLAVNASDDVSAIARLPSFLRAPSAGLGAQHSEPNIGRLRRLIAYLLSAVAMNTGAR